MELTNNHQKIDETKETWFENVTETKAQKGSQSHWQAVSVCIF